jgi:lipopolysaccharide/colanic/teichoic acid biosynthesis glycosyltransferase
MLVMAGPGLIIALIVKKSSPGPVFYRQERMGLDGQAFTVYKFRSMYPDAEDSTGPVWARDDPDTPLDAGCATGPRRVAAILERLEG